MVTLRLVNRRFVLTHALRTDPRNGVGHQDKVYSMGPKETRA